MAGTSWRSKAAISLRSGVAQAPSQSHSTHWMPWAPTELRQGIGSSLGKGGQREHSSFWLAIIAELSQLPG